jgi:hypothetical protein
MVNRNDSQETESTGEAESTKREDESKPGAIQLAGSRAVSKK